MTPAESNNNALSAIISSLLSAFDSSRQLFHRIKSNVRQESSSKAKLSRKHTPAQCPTSDEEMQARNEQIQLQRARRQIAKTYERNSGRYGDRYRRGDDRAKASLNHTLLVLNTGLTKIISSLLQQGPGNNKATIRNEARKSLLSLSEMSARDALMELEGLRMRLESVSTLSIPMQLKQRQRQQRNHRQIEDEQTQIGTQSTAKGGKMEGKKNDAKRDIGTKSSDLASGKESVVNTTKPSASRQSIAMDRPLTGKRKPVNHPVWVRSKNSSTIAIDTRPTYNRARSSSDTLTTRTRNTSKQPQLLTAAPSSSPGIIPQPRQQESPSNPPQPTTRINNRLSILSDSSGSTKLGEIPQHKWINPWIPPAETYYEEEYDYREQQPETDAKRRSQSHGLRFWRRLARNGDRT